MTTDELTPGAPASARAVLAAAGAFDPVGFLRSTPLAWKTLAEAQRAPAWESVYLREVPHGLCAWSDVRASLFDPNLIVALSRLWTVGAVWLEPGLGAGRAAASGGRIIESVDHLDDSASWDGLPDSARTWLAGATGVDVPRSTRLHSDFEVLVRRIAA